MTGHGRGLGRAPWPARSLHAMHAVPNGPSKQERRPPPSQSEFSMDANDSFHIAVIAGDGIGTEVMAPTLEILRKLEASHAGLTFLFPTAPPIPAHSPPTATPPP